MIWLLPGSHSLLKLSPFEPSHQVVRKPRTQGEATCKHSSWKSQLRSHLTAIINHHTDIWVKEPLDHTISQPWSLSVETSDILKQRQVIFFVLFPNSWPTEPMSTMNHYFTSLNIRVIYHSILTEHLINDNYYMILLCQNP